MDILAARKKAAERARELKKQEEPGSAPGIPAEEQPQKPEPEGEAAPISAEDVALKHEPVEPDPASAAIPVAGPTEEQPPVQELEMLSFRLGAEEYAVLVDDVKEVLKRRDLTPVPNAPDYILGVTALRGPILPVIDLSKRLGLPAPVQDRKSRILVLNVNDEQTGVLVDRVTGVVKIQPDAIRPVPESIEGGSEFLKGIARKDEKLYILLDIEKTLGA